MKTNELFSASARQGFASPNFLLTSAHSEKSNEHPYKIYSLGKGVKFLQCEFKNTADRIAKRTNRRREDVLNEIRDWEMGSNY